MISVKVHSPGTYIQFINAGLMGDSLVEEGLPSGMITQAVILEDLSINYIIAYWDEDTRRQVCVSELEFVVLTPSSN